jgi:hypothetical protein
VKSDKILFDDASVYTGFAQNIFNTTRQLITAALPKYFLMSRYISDMVVELLENKKFIVNFQILWK